MRKVYGYAMLFTLFLWLGGIVPMANAAEETLAQTGVHVDAAHESAAAEAHGDEMPFLLDVDLGSAIWNLIVFLLLLAVLAKFVWPPILKGLQQRDEKLRSDLEGAERANRDAQETLNQYKTQLAEAQREAQRIIEQSRSDAQRVGAELKEQAQNELTQMRQRAEADIETAKQQAIADLYEQTAVLATQVAGQILKREIRPEDHQSLVQESLSGLAATRN